MPNKRFDTTCFYYTTNYAKILINHGIYIELSLTLMYNKAMEKLNNLIKQIKKYNPDALCIVVDDKQFNEPFLLVSTNSMKQKIMLFDGNSDLDQFAEISYSRPTKGMVLASFFVDEEYQQQGFGAWLENPAEG